MVCNDCGKKLEGGFGIGERPFTKYHCAQCAIRDSHLVVRMAALQQVYDLLSEPKLDGKKYKQFSEDLLSSINVSKKLIKHTFNEL